MQYLSDKDRVVSKTESVPDFEVKGKKKKKASKKKKKQKKQVNFWSCYCYEQDRTEYF